ncbi:HET-domain-containing protein, partial [Trematosphaeria pertusa]
YVALSYVWGAAEIQECITVDGKSLSSTKNLRDFLWQLRKDPVPWADAICINQQDGEEKVHQIEIMRSIYRRAKLVVSMVGRPNEGMEMGIRMMRTIAEASSPQN